MSKKPPDQPGKHNQPKSARAEGEAPKSDSVPPKDRHSPTPCEDAEWEERMDELEDEREELHEDEVAQSLAMDPHELASIVQRLEALRAKSKELGQEETRLHAHIEEALAHLNQAVSELAEQRGSDGPANAQT
jgi:DNA repair exonuclease SbcCD ATPase subunit